MINILYIIYIFIIIIIKLTTKENWVSTGICEVLYIRRSLNPTDRWSGDLAFPGGKANPGENDRETCERETMEEVGLDLTSEK